MRTTDTGGEEFAAPENNREAVQAASQTAPEGPQRALWGLS